LKQGISRQRSRYGSGFNQPKTLSGIETSTPLLDGIGCDCFNQPKTLSGIETRSLLSWGYGYDGFNQPKTLSGIETKSFYWARMSDLASTNPKPFQGLKHKIPSISITLTAQLASTNPKPFQGLKREVWRSRGFRN